MPIRDGSRENPFKIGEGDSARFFGYGIEEYGNVDYSLKEYEDGKVTFQYTLNEYGNSNPLTFNTEFDVYHFENNCMLSVFPVDEISTFTISDTDYILPMKKVKIGCGQTKEVKYKIGEAKYVALLYYTLAEDGGDKDFVDKKLYGHLRFFDLSSEE